MMLTTEHISETLTLAAWTVTAVGNVSDLGDKAGEITRKDGAA